MGQQDVGPSGVATGRGAFNLSSSSSVGMKKAPTDGSFTLSNCKLYFLIRNQG
ncbi:hypothetical protein [Rummeliibacillus suwonensis]|uniref:hypothetical protein n=1 Tax=Rummeliibacillus suwonensis TaxID=1306154 RepID=UPI001645932B|nr:hypothetical protein [Rummeliibacillus suwonensis]MBO2537111.1 hypothetical protein [Rummeliibacillus suwonensis]